MDIRTIKEADFSGKRAIVRVDFNVPIDSSGNITDDNRIKEALPTIRYILDKGAKQVVLMSHLGKPKGPDPKLRMDNVAKRVQELLKIDVAKVDDCIDVALPSAKVVMLENLRFHAEEEKNDPKFAEKLSKYADIYVNDAFGTCHRAHASVHAITKYLPSYAGLLVEKEAVTMGKALENPEHPFVAIMGGSKVSDKIEVIQNLLPKVDYLLIGGAMMFTFYKSIGFETGKSLVENDKLGLAASLIKDRKIIIPEDAVVAEKADDSSAMRNVPLSAIPKHMIGLDIGANTIGSYKAIIEKAKTIIWNGPMGMFEIKRFAKGTEEIAKAVADATQKNNAVSIIGGGDSAAAIDELGLKDKVTHVSTGGGASLEFFAGKALPGIAVLKKTK